MPILWLIFTYFPCSCKGRASLTPPSIHLSPFTTTTVTTQILDDGNSEISRCAFPYTKGLYTDYGLSFILAVISMCIINYFFHLLKIAIKICNSSSEFCCYFIFTGRCVYTCMKYQKAVVMQQRTFKVTQLIVKFYCILYFLILHFLKLIGDKLCHVSCQSRDKAMIMELVIYLYFSRTLVQLLIKMFCFYLSFPFLV